MIVRRLLPTIVLTVASSAALLSATPGELLKRAEEADKHVSYRGIKTASVLFGGVYAKSTIKVVHLKPNKTRTEYFSPAALAGVILIQDGADLRRFHPGSGVWEQMCPRAKGSSDVVHQGLIENFDVRLIGTDSVAGRPAYVIYAAPRHGGESGRRVWVDREHYLVVATQVENPQGSVLKSSRYTAIEFNPDDISPSVFKEGEKVAQAPQPRAVPFKALKPNYLPKGYRMFGMSSLRVNGRCCIHLQFTNGVNTISLFERPADSSGPASAAVGKSRNVLVWARNGIVFTLIGSVPRSELQKIADSTK